MVSKLSTKNNTKFIKQSKQTINTPPNLKLTLSSMFKQMLVSTRDKSLNESARENERKHVIYDELLKLFPTKCLDIQRKLTILQ